MADINDLADLMESVDVQIKEQTGILRSILSLQERESIEAQRRWELSRADRDVEPTPRDDTRGPGPGPDSGPVPPTDNTLAGLIGGLTALFGKDILGRFALLAAGATALAGSIAVTIGLIKGQMTAIEVFFKAFAPGLVRTFDDFKVNLSNKFVGITQAFTEIVDDLKIKVSLVRVAVTEAFDSFSNTIKSLFSSGADSRFTNVINSIRSSLDILIEPFRTALVTIQELTAPTGSPSKIANTFKSIAGWLGELGSQIGKIASIVGKIFAPIAIIITAWDTIKGALDGYAEGGFLGGLKGAIDGFFTSLITVPLDLVKDLVAWVAGKFGFDETAAVLSEFSFTDLFKQITATIFSGVEGAISVITDIFTFGEEDKTTLGLLGKLTDIVYAPVNMAIGFVRGLFGFEKTDEPFKLQDWITEQINNIISSITEMFAFIPSVDELKTMMYNALPKLMQNLIDKPERGSLPQENYTNPVNEFGSMSFRNGTDGFMNFGEGTRATLHGVEAVVPKNTDAGQFLASNFDNDWKLRAIEANANRQATPIIINSPNNSQTNVNVRGGSSNSSTFVSGGSSELDFFGSIPSGAK